MVTLTPGITQPKQEPEEPHSLLKWKRVIITQQTSPQPLYNSYVDDETTLATKLTSLASADMMSHCRKASLPSA